MFAVFGGERADHFMVRALTTGSEQKETEQQGSWRAEEVLGAGGSGHWIFHICDQGPCYLWGSAVSRKKGTGWDGKDMWPSLQICP